MAAKGKKPETKGKRKGPDTRGIELDDAGRYRVQKDELSDEALDGVSGGTIFRLTDECKGKKKDPPTHPILQVCCPSVQNCKPGK